jgi:translation initiation factor IF-3
LIKKFHKQQTSQQQYRINERIFAVQLRVLDSEGKQIGILSKQEALAKAKEAELDLVEIAPQAQPPVAKVIDYKKFLYQQAKKHQEEKRKAKVSETKEVRFGPHMSDNDLQVMIGRAKGFLEDGDKVRLVVKFKGRAIVHPQFGHQTLQKVIDALKGIAKVDKSASMMGRQLMMVLSPEGKSKKYENEEKN